LSPTPIIVGRDINVITSMHTFRGVEELIRGAGRSPKLKVGLKTLYTLIGN